MKDFLRQWLQNLLDGRAVKDWTPQLWASPDVAKFLGGKLDGIKVMADASASPVSIPVNADDTLKPGTFQVWSLMAQYEGVRTADPE